MKVTLITVCYNSEAFIRDALSSVHNQSFQNIEYIIVDGKSNDRTISIIKEFEPMFGHRLKWISEPDNGIYDAMNKGIGLATGDIIGIVNSDDFLYENDVISKIVDAFSLNNIDATIGNVVFVNDNSGNIIRYYSARNWRPSKFAWGYMPPHPSFFVRRSVYLEFGLYKTDYKIAADYELLIRFLLKENIKWKYLPIITTGMRLGGASTGGFKSLITLNREILQACKENALRTNIFMIYSKYLFKPFEFIFRNRGKL